jgi:hypothetical protein
LPDRLSHEPDPNYDHESIIRRFETLANVCQTHQAQTKTCSRRHGYRPNVAIDVRRYFETEVLGTSARQIAEHDELSLRAVQKSIRRGREAIQGQFQSPDQNPKPGSTKQSPKW